jgi:hypothetical protein
MLVLLLALLTARTVGGQPGADILPVQGQESLGVPLRAVGQLSNGCTGYLIGPCHVGQRANADQCGIPPDTNSSDWHHVVM